MRGTIEKRTGPQGTVYRVRVELPADPVTGKRRRTSKTVTTRKEAQRLLAEWQWAGRSTPRGMDST